MICCSTSSRFWENSPVLFANHGHQGQPNPGKAHAFSKAISVQCLQAPRYQLGSSISPLLLSGVPKLGYQASIRRPGK